MANYLPRFTSVLLAAIMVAGCSSRKQTYSTAYHNAHPRFINNVSLNGKSNNISMDNVVNRHHHKKEIKQVANKDEPMRAPADKKSIINNLPEEMRDYAPHYLTLKYSYLMGVPPKSLTNYPLYKFIDEWYGVDYRLGGNDKSGIDCSAFVQKLYDQVFCMNLLRTALNQFGNCSMVWDMDKIKEGDLVFFHIHSKHITHVGVYLTNRYFVHASSSQGVVISNLNEDYWHKYFAGAGEIPHNNM